MRWKRTYRRLLKTEDPGCLPEEAFQADARADEALRELRHQAREVVEISRAARTLREQNNFAAMITALFGGTR